VERSREENHPSEESAETGQFGGFWEDRVKRLNGQV
jgi:hypothetical protein